MPELQTVRCHPRDLKAGSSQSKSDRDELLGRALSCKILASPLLVVAFSALPAGGKMNRSLLLSASGVQLCNFFLDMVSIFRTADRFDFEDR